MPELDWLRRTSPAFRLMIATSWLAPDSFGSHQEEAIREAIAAGPDWTEYLRLVRDRHRTPALSWAALSRIAGLEIPESARQELRKSSDACRMQALRHCILLAEVLKSFHRAGIPVMILKGPILSLELYGDVSLRQSRDLDLAVPQEDISRARASLELLGWRQEPAPFSMTPRQWETFLRQEYEITFVHPRTGCTLEIQWRAAWNTPAGATAIWRRSVPSHWQGCSFQVMSPDDIALYLCSHGAVHFWSRAKWLGDVARLHTLGRVDWEAALSSARRTGEERVLLSSLRLLELLYGLRGPALGADLRKDRLQALTNPSLRALTAPEEAPGKILGFFRFRLRLFRLERLLWPRKTRQERLSRLVYDRETFQTIPLPDSLFWVYIPLRPFLWAWRRARKLGSRGGLTPAARA